MGAALKSSVFQTYLSTCLFVHYLPNYSPALGHSTVHVPIMPRSAYIIASTDRQTSISLMANKPRVLAIRPCISLVRKTEMCPSLRPCSLKKHEIPQTSWQSAGPEHNNCPPPSPFMEGAPLPLPPLPSPPVKNLSQICILNFTQ